MSQATTVEANKKRKPSGELQSPRAEPRRRFNYPTMSSKSTAAAAAVPPASTLALGPAVFKAGVITVGKDKFPLGDVVSTLPDEDRQNFEDMPPEDKRTALNIGKRYALRMSEIAAEKLHEAREKNKDDAVIEEVSKQIRECDFNDGQPPTKFQKMICEGFDAMARANAAAWSAQRDENVLSRKKIRNLEREVADVRRQYCKYGLKIIGDLPPAQRTEDPVEVLSAALDAKYGIRLKREEVRACHRMPDIKFKQGGVEKLRRQMVLMLTANIKDSTYDRLLFRPGNWAGEAKGQLTMDLEISRLTARGSDSKSKAALLFVRKQDKEKPLETRRVKRVDVGRDGVPFTLDGKGNRRRFYHPEDAVALMSVDEAAQWTLSDEQKKDRRQSKISPGSMEMDESEARELARQ